jgi:hypothetical protein
MSHAARPMKPSRLLASYRAPRVGSRDVDFGGYYEAENDPRNDTVVCSACDGTKYDSEGDKCVFCAGRGWRFYDEE